VDDLNHLLAHQHSVDEDKVRILGVINLFQPAAFSEWIPLKEAIDLGIAIEESSHQKCLSIMNSTESGIAIDLSQ